MGGITSPNHQRTEPEQLYGEMAPHSLYPLWEVLANLVTPAPRSAARRICSNTARPEIMC